MNVADKLSPAGWHMATYKQAIWHVHPLASQGSTCKVRRKNAAIVDRPATQLAPEWGHGIPCVSALCTKSKRTLPFGRVFARWSSQRRSPRSQRAGQIADEPKEGRSRARQRAREVPRGPPCHWWSPGQRRSRQKENPTRFSSAEEPVLVNYRSVTRGVPFRFFLPSNRADPGPVDPRTHHTGNPPGS